MSINKNYIIIQDNFTFDLAMKHIEESEYLAYDTETTGLNVRKDKVIGFGFCGKIGTSFYLPIYKWDGQELIACQDSPIFCMEILQALKGKNLVMHNGSYDVRITKNDLEVDLVTRLVADTMLMKHTINEEGKFGLKATAIELQEHLKLDVEKAANEEQLELKENIKNNGGSVTKANYELYKADMKVIAKYCNADCDLTLRIFEYYYDKLEEEDLLEFFFDEEVMPLYREVTIPMEDHGVKLDMDLINEVDSEITADMTRIEESIQKELTEIAPEFIDGFLEKNYPVSTKGSFGQKVVELYLGTVFNEDYPKTPSGKFRLTEKAIKENSRPTRQSGFLLGNSELEKEGILKIQKALHIDKTDSQYFINIQSKDHLSQIFYEILREKPLSKTDKGKAKFTEDDIIKLSKKYEFLSDLRVYNKLLKIKSTYIDRFLDRQENGYYHFSYKQHGTISGRYGSDAQQLPRPMGYEEDDEIIVYYNNFVRQFFIAGEGRKFIDADYESLEPHVFSHVSNDEGLRDIFRKGHDFYSTIAIATEGLTGVSADKKAENYLGAVNKPLRQKAKAYSLGIPYGMKSYALGKSLDIEQEDAEELINGYLNGFPELKKWMKDSERQAKLYGFVRSEAGRVRHLPRVKELFPIHGDKLLDFRYRNKIKKRYGEDEVLNMYRDYKNGLNNAKNFQIQSLSASIVNRAAIEMSRQFVKNNINAWVCGQTHDQIIVNCPAEVDKEVKDIVEYVMESVYKLSVDLKAPAEIGDNWYETH